MLIKSSIIFLLFFSTTMAFGESHPEYSSMDNPSEYNLEIDDHYFLIPYEVNAKLLSMDIDKEQTSLLIGLLDTKDSIFKIDLPHEMINDSNNDFTILVDGIETDYDVVSDSDSSSFSFFVPEFSEEVEIIGTHVIPEFPLGAIFGLAIFTTLIITITRFPKNFLRL